MATGAPFKSWRNKFFGNNASDNGTDDLAIWFDHIVTSSTRFGIGVGGVLRYAPGSQPSGGQAINSALDIWGIAGANNESPTSLTIDEHNGASFQVSAYAETGKTLTTTLARAIKVTAPTDIGSGTINVTSYYGIDIENCSGFATNSGAIRIANNNYIVGRNAANDDDKTLLGIDSSNNVIFGDSSVAMLLNGSIVLSIPAFGLSDGITAPTAIPGFAQIYVDTADGDLKVRFGDGVTKTLATDV